MRAAMRRTLTALIAIGLLASPAGAEPPATAPRYVSLKTAGANGRNGPGVEHRIDWVYQRVGLPLEVLGESGPWRRVRDPDGAEVWMHERNLESRRTAYVAAPAQMRRAARPGAATVAFLAPGVIGALTGCSGDWRRVAVAGRVGWVDKAELWGAEDCSGL